jgi:hypothetical protein
MNKLVVSAVAIVIVIGAAYYISDLNDPCNRTLSYAIGDIDSRFEVTETELKGLLADVEKVWEEPTGKNLFEYDPSSSFKVNFVFDERQQKTIDEQEMRQQIDLGADSYETVLSAYNNLNYHFKRDSADYEVAKSDYERRLADYNAQVAYWNNKGGASGTDYKRLSSLKDSLETEARSLEQTRLELNQTVQTINSTADRLNELARRYNRDVDAYNGLFGYTRQFDQGTYTGNSINIFQFNNLTDLKLVLAHEFGHALSLEHVDDEYAVMYYLMDKQDVVNLQATKADMAALKKTCSLK